MRTKLIYLLIALVFALLCARLYQLSVLQNEMYEELALQNATKAVPLPPVRAQITDRRGELLAVNELGFSALLAPHLNKVALAAATSSLAGCFNLDAAALLKTYKKHNSFYNQDFIEVIDFADYETTQRCMFSLLQNPNIRLEASIKRLYPYRTLASHIIGYVGKANSADMLDDKIAALTKRVGKEGIERFYNERLQGEPGLKITQVDSHGKQIALLQDEKPSNPEPLALTLDIRLQQFIDEIFADKAGAVVVMDVRNGDILAAGSYPEYDLNLFVRGISNDEWQLLLNDLSHPFTNKLVNGKYPPGSIVKMGVGMSFLASGKITPATTTTCTASFELGGRKFRCHNVWGHGKMDLVSAIRSSCDDYFYKGSLQVGIDAMSQTLARLGFGRRTGIDLPLESPAILPNPLYKMQRWKKPWFQGETLNTSIGQGEFLVTPMQVAAYTATLATGEFVRPRLSLERPVQKSSVLLPSELAALLPIRAGMKAVANDSKGTAARHLKGVLTSVAAKTGTAQVVGISQSEKQRMREEHMEHYSRSHAWINAYAPADEPQVAIAIIVEHGMHGGSTAGPIAREIINKLIELGYVKKE